MLNSPSALHILNRIGAGLLGSYAFGWGFVTLGIVLLLLAGVEYGEAQTLLYLLAFILFLICFCWAFAARAIGRVWSVLAGGGSIMTGAAWLIARSLGA